MKKYFLLSLLIIWFPATTHASIMVKTSTISNLTNGLVGLWSFDAADVAGTTAYDRSGQGNNATTTGFVAKVVGEIGQAFGFNGSSSFVQVSGNVPTGSTPVSFSFWFKLNSAFNSSTAASQPFLSIREDDNNNFFIALAGTAMNNDHASAPGRLEMKLEVQKISGTAHYVISNTSSWKANTWYHVVAIKDAADNDTLYINGVNDTGGSLNTSGRNVGAINGTWRIGQGNYDTLNEAVQYLNGTIDDVRIYNRALSPTEVKQLYNMGAANKTNITPSTKVVNNNGLIDLWSFDAADVAGITAYDRSGQGNNATTTGVVAKVVGKIGQALLFGGINQYAVGKNVVNTAKVTVSAWVNISSYPSANGMIIGFVNGLGATVHDKDLYIGTDGKPYFYVFDGGGKTTSAPANALALNKWNHIVGIADGTNAYTYVNGVQVGSVAAGNTYTSYTAPNIFVSGTEVSGSAATYIKASIDEVRVYNRALSAAEVKNLYNAGGANKVNITPKSSVMNGLLGLWTFDAADLAGVTAYDRSGQGNNGTLTNGPVRIPGRLGQGLSFDGVDDFVSAGNVSASPANAASLWFNANAVLNSTSAAQTILELDTSGQKAIVFGVSTGFLTNEIISVFTDAGAFPRSGYCAAGVNISGWHFLEINWNGSLYDIYLDGVKVNNCSAGTNLQITPTAVTMGKGTVTGVANMYSGKIDDVRIYNRALTPVEIKTLYNSGK